MVGKLLEEPVAWYGPIMMNRQEQLRHTFEELREGTFLDSSASGRAVQSGVVTGERMDTSHKNRERVSHTRLPRVVIVGGAFGGLYAARGLARAPGAVTVVDKHNYHLFRPMLYRDRSPVLGRDRRPDPLDPATAEESDGPHGGGGRGRPARPRRVHARGHGCV
jgi:hypothetical protein